MVSRSNHREPYALMGICDLRRLVISRRRATSQLLVQFQLPFGDVATTTGTRVDPS